MKRKLIYLISFLILTITLLMFFGSAIRGENTMILNISSKRGNLNQEYTVVTPDGTAHIIPQIIKKVNGGYSTEDKLYSLRNGFGSISKDTEYTEKFNLKTDATDAINYFKSNLGFSDISDIEYNAILWIIDNMYLPEIDAEETKNKLFENAGISNSELNNDDIEFVQQMALWYYTNADQNGADYSLSLLDTYKLSSASLLNGNSFNASKSEQIDKLYRYFIENALLCVGDYGTGESRDVTLIKGEKTYKTVATMWVAKKQNAEPILRITREEVKDFDLALRQYIISVNGVAISDARNPKINENEYLHKKNAVEVNNGDRITYRISVYNEGKVSGDILSIIDILPEGLEFRANNNTELLKKYSYEYYEEQRIIRLIPKNNENSLFTLSSNKNTQYVDIVLTVTATKQNSDTILTNIVTMQYEPTNDEDKNVQDVDSTQQLANFKLPANTTEWMQYSGNGLNKPYLGDENYYYKGQEDDDDFEKVVIKGIPFDLSLTKFITDVNGKKITSRIPKIDVSRLNKTNETNGEKIESAEYITNKEPVIVKKGDIVTYTIRIYNEGDLDGIATEITEYIPEGLGYLLDYKKNTENFWKVINNESTHTIHLIGEDGLYEDESNIKNLKVEDFESFLTEYTSLNQVEILAGEAQISTSGLADKKIKAFDASLTSSKAEGLWQKSENGENGLYYRDIEITCIVIGENGFVGTRGNVTEISNSKAVDKANKEIMVEDRDSTPGNVYDDRELLEDDADYELIKLGEFDLSLKEYFSYLVTKNGEITEQKERNIKIDTDEEGDLIFKKNIAPGYAENTDYIVYTIRVYNEGTIIGYANEIVHNLPKGLVFLTDNNINKEYEWKMYDAEGNVTDNLEMAKELRTNYLKDKAIEIYDRTQNVSEENPGYEEIMIAFQVDENQLENGSRIINSYSHITKQTAEIQEIVDSDSTPGKWIESDDDQDTEEIYIGKFDLALFMNISKIFKGNEIIAEPEQKIYENENQEIKIKIKNKDIKNSEIKIVYNITVANQGDIVGYVEEITDYIPDELEFKQEDNPNWIQASENVVKTRYLAEIELQPGDTKSVELILTWKGGTKKLGQIKNYSEISMSKNAKEAKDFDSLENNFNTENYTKQEDDEAVSTVIIKKDNTIVILAVLIITVLVVIIGSIVLIKKHKRTNQ